MPSIPYCAEPDGARPCEASDIRDARMGIPYRAEPDGARPCEASDIRDARMGIPFPFNKLRLLLLGESVSLWLFTSMALFNVSH